MTVAPTGRSDGETVIRGTIRRVIYIVDYPFNAVDYARFGLDTMLASGFQTEVWDMSAWLQPDLHVDFEPFSPSTDVTLLRVFSWKQARGLIGSLSRCCFVFCIANYRYESRALFRALSRVDSRRGLMVHLALPVASRPDTRPLAYVRNKFAHIRPGQLMRSLFARLPPSWLGVVPVDVAFLAAEGALGGALIGARTEHVWIHSFAYDEYVRITERIPSVDPSMAVFIDQFLPLHPDWIDYPGGPVVPADEYYALLRQFFDRVESELNVRVVVAAHPRSNYDKRPDYFGGRPVVKDQTAELVCGSRFVIVESSMASGFAVLFRKPTVFITNDVYETSERSVAMEHRAQIHLMARHFGTQPVNISRTGPLAWDRLLTMDDTAYDRYQNHFIKKLGSPRDYYWNVVAEYLRSLA